MFVAFGLIHGSACMQQVHRNYMKFHYFDSNIFVVGGRG